MQKHSFALRVTPEREVLFDRLRAKMEQVGRDTKRVHGIITDAAVIEAALKALEKELDQEIATKGE